MGTVSKSALKARMLEHFRQVEETEVPVAEKRPMSDVLAEFRAIGPVRFAGDPNAPTVDEWDDA